VLDGEVIFTDGCRPTATSSSSDHGHRYYTLTGGLAGIRFQAGQWVRQGEILGHRSKR
jgi:hypothetical protein